MGQTYVVPDGHDQNHGEGKGLVERGEPTDLLEAVPLVKDGVHVGAVLGGDVGGLRDALSEVLDFLSGLGLGAW
jgi:hypothetical protein